METWWSSLELFQKVVWLIAIPSSLIFIIQMIATFVGMDSDGGMVDSADMDGSIGDFPFQLFTFRNFVNFFLGFGWTGVLFYNTIESKFWLVFLAAVIGLALVIGVMAIFYFLSRMVQSGNIDVKSAVGLHASVYLTIPSERKGQGKIQISIQNAVREYDAITDGDEIRTGGSVIVKDIINSNLVLVEKL